MVNQGLTTQYNKAFQSEGTENSSDKPFPQKKLERRFEMEKGEDLVKQEYGVSHLQGEDCAKTPEETNLIRKIESRTKNLMQSLNSIEGVTKGLNKNLLPQLPKDESKVGVDQRSPQGWLECHLADLDHSLYRCAQIYDEVSRLLKETQIDEVGQ